MHCRSNNVYLVQPANKYIFLFIISSEEIAHAETLIQAAEVE